MREWLADYLEAANRHDLDAVRALVDPAVRRAHLPGGADAWIADLAALFQSFPDWQWRRIQVIVEDDRLAVHLRASGTSPAGRHVNIAEFGFFRVVAGRVTEYTGTADYAGLVAG
jgi:predicted ester cyclase